jgi:hypothetical protein
MPQISTSPTQRVRNLIIAFVIVTIAAMCIRPQAIERYLTASDQFYDAKHYVTIALEGYVDPAITAFFPLWPWLLSVTSAAFGITDRVSLALAGSAIATLVFMMSIGLFVRIVRRDHAFNTMPFVIALFVFNPFNVFRVLPFTESLCTLILLGLLNGMQRQTQRFTELFVLALLASLARPVWAFLPIAALGAFVLSRLFGGKALPHVTLAIATGSLVGLGLFCGYLALTTGDAAATFKAQEIWGRSLGLHWELIWAPKSVGGSDDVLIWDLIAFWGPILLVATAFCLALFRRMRHGNRPIDGDFVFWIAALFACGHALAAFLTYPIFASLGRHVFGVPFFIYAVGRYLGEWRESPIKTNTLRIAVAFSFISYIRWWTRFAKGGWIG